MSIRKPTLAGTWYPGSRQECVNEIETFLNHKPLVTHLKGDIKAGIVPHAGWQFSGDLACNVFNILSKSSSEHPPDVIVIFGMHMPAGTRPVIMKEGGWDTPLGIIDVAEDLGEKLASQIQFTVETPNAFTPENTIEVQMPLVKYFFNGAKVLTIGPPAGPAAMEIGDTVVKTAETLGLRLIIVASTDLTHYGPNFGFSPAGSGRKAYEWVRDKNDRAVVEKMLAMDPEGVIAEGLSNHNACCPGAAAAGITAAKCLGAKKSELLGYSSSYEKNPGDTFVGYAGVVYAT